MDGVADAMNCSVPTVYRLVEDGYLTTFRIGRRRYASPRAVRKCVERLEEIGAVLPAQSGGNNRNGPGRSPAITPQAEVA
jgi:excisionase family DNA binding protein